MTSIWLEVKKALLADAERARGHANTEGPVETRDGVKPKGHVHDRLHDELRAFERIGGQTVHPRESFYPDEGVSPRMGGDGEHPWKRRDKVKDTSEVSEE